MRADALVRVLERRDERFPRRRRCGDGRDGAAPLRKQLVDRRRDLAPARSREARQARKIN